MTEDALSHASDLPAGSDRVPGTRTDTSCVSMEYRGPRGILGEQRFYWKINK